MVIDCAVTSRTTLLVYSVTSLLHVVVMYLHVPTCLHLTSVSTVKTMFVYQACGTLPLSAFRHAGTCWWFNGCGNYPACAVCPRAVGEGRSSLSVCFWSPFCDNTLAHVSARATKSCTHKFRAAVADLFQHVRFRRNIKAEMRKQKKSVALNDSDNNSWIIFNPRFSSLCSHSAAVVWDFPSMSEWVREALSCL